MTDIYIAVAGVGLALLGVVGVWVRGWLKGKAEAERKQKDRDNERTRTIQTAADRARAADDAGHVDTPAERLRRLNRLRD